MEFKQKEELLIEFNEQALLADGFEEALIGVSLRAGQPPIATYDRGKCIQILERNMTNEEAEEYFAHNVECAWVGRHTPTFFVPFEYELGR